MSSKPSLKASMRALSTGRPRSSTAHERAGLQDDVDHDHFPRARHHVLAPERHPRSDGSLQLEGVVDGQPDEDGAWTIRRTGTGLDGGDALPAEARAARGQPIQSQSRAGEERETRSFGRRRLKTQLEHSGGIALQHEALLRLAAAPARRFAAAGMARLEHEQRSFRRMRQLEHEGPAGTGQDARHFGPALAARHDRAGIVLGMAFR
jgi:hypothetical protein